MLQPTKIKEYRLNSLNMLLPKALEEIETNLEYLIYNMIFLKECFKDFEEAFSGLMELREIVKPEDSAKEIIVWIEKVSSDLELNYLAKEIPKAITDSLDGLRELLRSTAGIRGLTEAQEQKKDIIDINEVLINLTLALKREWSPNSKLNMSLDSKLSKLRGVKSDLHYALGRSLFYHMCLLGSFSKNNANKKGTLSIMTAAQNSHNEIRISSHIDSGPCEISSYLPEGDWQKDLEFIKWVITSEHQGEFEIHKECSSKCETIMRLPFS